VVEIGKDLTNGTSEAKFDLGNGVLGGEGSNVILQGLQGGNVVVGQEIAP
jgi:hypothetical protein